MPEKLTDSSIVPDPDKGGKPKSNAVIIKEYFGEGMGTQAFMADYKGLSKEEQQQLGDGLRDGSLNY